MARPLRVRRPIAIKKRPPTTPRWRGRAGGGRPGVACWPVGEVKVDGDGGVAIAMCLAPYDPNLRRRPWHFTGLRFSIKSPLRLGRDELNQHSHEAVPVAAISSHVRR